MFCSKCGNKVDENADFCQECGHKMEPQNNKSTQTLAEKLAKENPVIPLLNNFKKLILNHKKPIFISMAFLILFICTIFLYNLLFGFEKLSWNEAYTDNDLKYITQTNIKLGINFSNEKNIEKIKYSTTCGEIENKNLEIIWDLTEQIGKCEITATYKFKKISKEYNVIPFDINDKELVLNFDINLDSDEDLDLDGLTNKQEKEYKTNPLLADTDMDGLEDYYEIFTSKTDPTKKDSDGDGLNDYDEIELGLNPLSSSTNNDGIKDGDRTLTYNFNSNDVKIKITGKGNIASTISEINTNNKISKKVGLIDKLYTFHTDGTISEAIVTIKYTNNDLGQYNLNEDNLSIYYFNEKEAKYEKIETTIDKNNKTLTATLKHFSNYVIGDTTLTKETSTTQILFVLDNSWSMYTNEQYKEITGKEYTGGLLGGKLDGFDSSGIRFTLTSKLITNLSKNNYQIGLSEFRSDYKNALSIGSDVNSLKEKLKNMNGNFITNNEGTNINNALTNGIKEFTKESDNKYIVILTDGQDSSLSSNTKKIIDKALDNDVKICSIGFGGGSYNTELANISNGTGCKFYSSSNVNGLTELFENIRTELNNDLVDMDGDNNVDGILMADSGFIVNRDGFSFNNYGSNLSTGGHCYGMATFAQLYYKKQLPLKLDTKTAKEDISYAYNLTNTYFKNYANLYDYKLKTNELKYKWGFEYFDEENPSDLRVVENNVLIYNSKYSSEIEKSGIYEYKKPEKTGSKKEDQLKKYGFTYDTYIEILFNEDNMQISKAINNDDKQLFNAIYAGFIKQNVATHYSSGTNSLTFMRNLVGSEKIEYSNGPAFINILKSRLDDQDAPVITSTFSGGLHAINAISLVQDIDNPNYYYIGVYDNNYPGEKRYVDLECKKDKCITKTNSYYSGTDQPIRITPSLEFDLIYYNN